MTYLYLFLILHISENGGKFTFTFEIYVLSFNSVYWRQASNLHNAPPRKLVKHTPHRHSDWKKNVGRPGKSWTDQRPRNGKSLLVLWSTKASYMNCTIYENNKSDGSFAWMWTFPLACSGWRGQMIWRNRRQQKVHNDIHYIRLGWQTKHCKDGQGM